MYNLNCLLYVFGVRLKYIYENLKSEYYMFFYSGVSLFPMSVE